MSTLSPVAIALTHRRVPPRVMGALAAVVTVLIWTAFIVVARASADPTRAPTLTTYDIMLARLLGAGLLLLPLGFVMTYQQRLRQLEAFRACGQSGAAPLPQGSLLGFSPLPLGVTLRIGVFGGLLYALVTYSGFAFAPAAHASVLLPGSLPLWTALLALWMLGAGISPTRALGLLCIVAGDLLVGGPGLLHVTDGSGVWLGDLLFVVGSVAWAVYSVWVRKYALPAVHATTAITVLGFFVYVPVYVTLLATGLVQGHFFSAPLRDVLLQMAMQGVGSVVVSGITFNMMIRYYGPVRSTMLTALVPGLSAVSAGWLLHEPLTTNVLAGLLLVTVGIVFGVQTQSPSGVKKS